MERLSAVSEQRPSAGLPHAEVLPVSREPRPASGSVHAPASSPPNADLRDTAYILREARRALDFTRPIAVLLLAVLHFIPDTDDPAGIVAALAGPLTAGSSVAISHLTADSAPEAVNGGVAACNTLVPTPVIPCTHAQVTGLFGGLPLVPPGVVPASEWRPDPTDTGARKAADVYAGAGRKPHRRSW